MSRRVKWTACLVLLPALAFAQAPAGWIKAGSHPAEYDMGVDTAVHHGGGRSGYVKATAKELHGFGTLMQQTSASQYLGKRVRLSAFVKADKVNSGWAGMWLRIDGSTPMEVLGFDNMQGRPLRGTSDWKRVEVVLDVPEKAQALAFGILLAGDGQVWIDDFSFETVSKDVPLTARGPSGGPQNLNFEK